MTKKAHLFWHADQALYWYQDRAYQSITFWRQDPHSSMRLHIILSLTAVLAWSTLRCPDASSVSDALGSRTDKSRSCDDNSDKLFCSILVTCSRCTLNL